jgi:hypothetical protein
METGNLRKTRWKSEKSPKEIHLEPDGHLNPTRNLMGSGASFHLQMRVHVSNSHQLYFFMGQVFDQPDPNRPIIIPNLSSEEKRRQWWRWNARRCSVLFFRLYIIRHDA